MTHINKYCFNYLNKYSHLTNTELKKQSVIMLVALLTSLSSFFLAIFYLIVQCWSLLIINLMGSTTILLCYILSHQKKYNEAGILLTVILVSLIISDDFFVGNSNYSILYLFLVLIVNMLIPYSKRLIPIVIGLFLPFLMSRLFLFGLQHTPRYILGDVMMYYGVFNILVSSIGVAILMGLNRYIECYIDFYSQEKISTLQTQAYSDALTKLHNRRYADIVLKKIQNDNTYTPISIALIDVDNFKKVNDTYGHDAGDITLKQVAQIIKNNVRKTDFVFRWGGEEFLVLLNNISPEVSFKIFDKIRQCVQENTVTYFADKFNVTITIGVASLDTRDIAESIDNCDKKMYEGKRTGKNKVII